MKSGNQKQINMAKSTNGLGNIEKQQIFLDLADSQWEPFMEYNKFLYLKTFTVLWTPFL
jgi:hypothetical protein